MPKPSPRATLPRSARIRSSRAFVGVFRSGLRASDNFITLHAATNEETVARLGISVGRRFGGAIRRNRIKRLVREAFRRIRHELPPGVDYVVVPRPGPEPDVDHLQASLRTLAQRLWAKLQRERLGQRGSGPGRASQSGRGGADKLSSRK